MNILVEGIGSPVFGPQLKYYKDLKWNIVGIDITNMSFGLYKDIKPYIVPKYSQANCFEFIEEIIEEEQIDIAFPTVNEGLLMWSKLKHRFQTEYNTFVMISDETVIDICTDKWKTYLFFKDNHIPTPKTSLKLEYDLLKPRVGRGSAGIMEKVDVDENFTMEGYISQEIARGQEYTIDVLCDLNSNPIYIIPRKRIQVESGVSIQGMTVYDKDLIDYAYKIVELLKPIGIINIQCFKSDSDIRFIEINPRIGGGASLSFASSDNWFRAVECFVHGREYIPKSICYNNYMMRYYSDLIVSEDDLIKIQ